MKIIKSLIAVVVFSFIFSNTGLIFCQDEEVKDSDALWILGEVVSVDNSNKTVIVKYNDYDTETEKEVTFSIDKETTFENAVSLEDIRVQDFVSIDYLEKSNGSNIAKNISLERAEGSVSDDQGPNETTPEDLQSNTSEQDQKTSN